MIKAKFKLILAAALSASFLVTPLLTDKASAAESKSYKDKFLELRNDLSNSSNGYYRTMENGLKIPYHARETFLCEGPDYAHETTSETYSYYVWLEAMYGKFSGDWTEFNNAWKSLETYMIPQDKDQPNNDYYKADDPADMANEYLSTSKYPSEINGNSSDPKWAVGKDDLASELKSTYGTSNIYGMHWLLDTDNWYQYGTHGKDGSSGYTQDGQPVFINTYQRGPHESAFKTVTHPSWEDCKTYGSDDGKSGFLSLFTKDYTNPYAHQWRYTIASDADARAIQATYWADKWSKDDNDGKSQVTADVSKATKLGDYLRYSMYDKYFREIGTGSNGEKQGTNKHYLLGWYYSWGGDTDKESWGSWAWRIGCSHNHFGYQNPMAAWVLSNNNTADDTSDFTSKTTNGQKDWKQSLDRQVELYQWLQSDEGAIAGGCTNSYTTDDGSYQTYPAGSSTFYGMIYDEAPVYLDPPSNRWFGMQVWSLQRLAEYYYETGDVRAQSVLNKWAKWAIDNTTFTSDSYKMPANLAWEGQPGTWNESTNSSDNTGLHVKVESYTDADIGVAGSYANTLFYISAANAKYNYADSDITTSTKETGEKLLDIMWNNYKDEYGIAKAEEIDPANYFDSEVYIPDGWTGKMGNGDVIKSGAKFIDIRSGYKSDPDYAKVKAAYDNNEKTTMTYHRYWAQVDAALAYGTHDILFPDVRGDINGDGTIDISDYTLFRKYFNAGAENGNVKIVKDNADVNEDGVVNFFDLVALKDKIK